MERNIIDFPLFVPMPLLPTHRVCTNKLHISNFYQHSSSITSDPLPIEMEGVTIIESEH
jgi:hypothetical protein